MLFLFCYPQYTDTVSLHSQQTSTKVKVAITSVALKRDGSQIAVSAGQKILLYQSDDGALLQLLKGHKDIVYTLSFSNDGQRLASGGADNSTIIWHVKEGKGILKFSHSESVQVVLYNPSIDLLASCSNKDFGFWSSKQRSVNKYPVESKILSASWTMDGQILALGLFSGTISLRNTNGKETISIIRSDPIWTLDWNPHVRSNEMEDILVVGCWDKTISFYLISGTKLYDDLTLDYYPCSLTHFGDTSEFILVGGSDKRVTLLSHRGFPIVALSKYNEWVWSIKGDLASNSFWVGDEEGNITLSNLSIEKEYSSFDNWLAYRDQCTDVIVDHLPSRQKVRIKCNDYVRKISIYRARVAIQITDRIHVYDLALPQDTVNMISFQLSENIKYDTSHSLFTLVLRHIVVCSENKIQLHDFKGNIVREWVLKSNINCLKVIQSPPGREGIIMGLIDGTVTEIFVDRMFTFEILFHSTPINFVEISWDNKYIALIDDKTHLCIYNKTTAEMLLKLETDYVRTVCFHREIGDVFCYGGRGKVTVQTLSGVRHEEDFNKKNNEVICVVSFVGSQIVCANSTGECYDVDVTLSSIAQQQIRLNDCPRAIYKVARLGVLNKIWRSLAYSSLQAGNFNVAEKSFLMLGYTEHVELVRKEQSKVKTDDYSSKTNMYQMLAEAAALEERFEDTGKWYLKAGYPEKTLELYVTLKKFEEAKRYVLDEGKGKKDKKEQINKILREEAKWAEKMEDWKRASEIYFKCGEITNAVKVIGETKSTNWESLILEMAQTITSTNIESLQLCAMYLSQLGRDHEVKIIYTKIGDYSKLMNLCIKKKNWLEVDDIYKAHADDGLMQPELLKYAEWLVIQGRLEEGFLVYGKIQCLDVAKKLVLRLVNNAIVQGKNYYVFQLYLSLALKSGLDYFVSKTSKID